MCPPTTVATTTRIPDGGKDSGKQNGGLPEEQESAKVRSSWPEADGSLSFFAQTWQRWTYSYMNPLLNKGARQTLDDGTHISADDLFRVPETMESALLSEKFE